MPGFPDAAVSAQTESTLAAGAPAKPTSPARIFCVGGAVVDRSYRLLAPLRPETSNPAAGTRGFGGVARNVAENLFHLGVPVGLVSRVGDDEGGAALLANLDALGIDRRGVRTEPGARTAEYAAVLTPGGDLALGLADMAILDGLTPDALAEQAELFAAATWIFADCNLPPESLSALVRRSYPGRYRLAVDAVSVAKSTRLSRRLDGIDLLFLNRDEAAALSEREGYADLSPPKAAAMLRGAGAGAVVLTLGPAGAIAATENDVVTVPGVAAHPVDVTGAGDSLVAAVLWALMRGAGLPDAVALGCRAAAYTVERPLAVTPTLAEALLGCIDAIPPQFTKVSGPASIR